MAIVPAVSKKPKKTSASVRSSEIRLQTLNLRVTATVCFTTRAENEIGGKNNEQRKEDFSFTNRIHRYQITNPFQASRQNDFHNLHSYNGLCGYCLALR